MSTCDPKPRTSRGLSRRRSWLRGGSEKRVPNQAKLHTRDSGPGRVRGFRSALSRARAGPESRCIEVADVSAAPFVSAWLPGLSRYAPRARNRTIPKAESDGHCNHPRVAPSSSLTRSEIPTSRFGFIPSKSDQGMAKR